MQWNEFDQQSMETETTWSEPPNERRATVELILASEEINKSKRTVTVRDQRKEAKHLWVRYHLRYKKYNRV